MRRLLRMRSRAIRTRSIRCSERSTCSTTRSTSRSSTSSSGDPDPVTRTVPITVTRRARQDIATPPVSGYGTDTSARGKFSWDNRASTKTGIKFKIELLGSSIVTDLTARYASSR